MLANLKKWGIYVLCCLCIAGVSILVGHYVWREQPQTIIAGGGAIVYKTNIHYVPIPVGSNSGCNDVIGKYNSLLADYKLFLDAEPRVYNVTESKIMFSLATQKYSIDYSFAPKVHWYVSPILSVKVDRTQVSYGGGVAFDYINIGAAILAYSDISAAAMIYYRIQL